ncbi:hypothetical protein NHQ30_009752 [Ciborinia camelliae]|nr:hypothetical protein NHQ30_009752 [Ciborinia camelliae]
MINNFVNYHISLATIGIVHKTLQNYHPNSTAQNMSNRHHEFDEYQESAMSSGSSLSRQRLHLPDLPMETLMLICGHLIDIRPSFPRGSPSLMMALRLTSRVIQYKTQDFFERMAFHSVSMHLDSRDLSRLTSISNHPHFASRVQEISVLSNDKELSAEDYDNAFDTMTRNPSESLREIASENRRRSELEQVDKASIEHSATDGIVMVSALQRFPNLHTIFLPCADLLKNLISIRRKQYREGPSTNHIFSMMLSSLAHANVRPQNISMCWIGGYNDQEGLSTPALSLPDPVPACLSELQILKLRLQPHEKIYKSK